MRRRLVGRLVRRLARKQHPRHPGQAEILERDGRLQPYAAEAATVCGRGCNRMRQSEAATVCDGQRLQPCATVRGCNRV